MVQLCSGMQSEGSAHAHKKDTFSQTDESIFVRFSDPQSEVFTERLPPAGINRASVGSNVAVVLFPTSHYSQAEPPLWLNGFPPPNALREAPSFCTYAKPRVSWINCLQLITEIKSFASWCRAASLAVITWKSQQWRTEAAVSLQPGAGMWPFDMWPPEEIKQDGMSLDKLPSARFRQRLHWLQQLVVEIHTMGRQIYPNKSPVYLKSSPPKHSAVPLGAAVWNYSSLLLIFTLHEWVNSSQVPAPLLFFLFSTMNKKKKCNRKSQLADCQVSTVAAVGILSLGAFMCF